MHATTVVDAVLAGLTALCVAGCGSSGGDGGSAPVPQGSANRIRLESRDFSNGAAIPARFTCAGGGRRPALSWSGVPGGAKQLALLVQDPDAPGGTFVHWVVYAIPPQVSTIRPGAPPLSAREGRNSLGRPGWTPPCPPRGAVPHRYVFTLLALRRQLSLPAGATAAQVVAAAGGQTLARGQLVGHFGR